MTTTQRKKLTALARQKLRVKVTSRRRSASGFVVTHNATIIHHCPTFLEAYNRLLVHMRIMSRVQLAIKPAQQPEATL